MGGRALAVVSVLVALVATVAGCGDSANPRLDDAGVLTDVSRGPGSEGESLAAYTERMDRDCGTPPHATTTMLAAEPVPVEASAAAGAGPVRLLHVAVDCAGGAGGTYGRVVFEFEEAVPGYSAEVVAAGPAAGDWADPDDEVLRVRLRPVATGARGQATDANAGPARVPSSRGPLVGAVLVEQTDDSMTWLVVFRHDARPFTARADGTSLVVRTACC